MWLSLSLSSASCAALHSAHLRLHKLTPRPPHILALRRPPPTAWELQSPWTDCRKLLGFVIFLHLTFKGIGPLVQQRFMECLPW